MHKHSLVLTDLKVLKVTIYVILKRGNFYVFFRNYATGSGQKSPEMVKFNSAHRELSIKGRYIAVVQVEAR